MTEQINVRKMSKKDLLELLVLQSKKIDELQEKLEHVNMLLESKKIMISEVGSIAEASLKLNKIFEIAQQAADQYLYNIKIMENELKGIKFGKKRASSKKKSENVIKKLKSTKGN